MAETFQVEYCISEEEFAAIIKDKEGLSEQHIACLRWSYGLPCNEKDEKIIKDLGETEAKRVTLMAWHVIKGNPRVSSLRG